ncbi:MAG: DUF3048 domain-containing protein [Chloroflexi bacterium]|nr:DUF3048 domain-containing protein [Chloroflexota bacterium]
MKKLLYGFVFLLMVLTACGPAASATGSAPTEIPVASATPPTPTVTPSSQPSPTPLHPSEGNSPSNFPSNVNPLTGLQVADPTLLDRRPLLIKVSNLPRSIRPQWGLSLADIVFEYYTEEGGTRFAALFYGNNADMVGPIRSGRFIDAHLVRGYKAVFAFGSAYVAEMDRFLSSEFADRLVIEGSSTPLFRNDPNGLNNLMANTATLSAYATSKGIQNRRQNLDGMSFNLTAPAAGKPAMQVIVRYSGSIYNRWDYDTSTGKYLRFSDSDNDYNNQNEQYAPATDRLTGQPIAFNNVVVLYVTHELYSAGIYDILFSGSGDGVAFRDGQAVQVKWQRNDTDVVSLTNPDGTPFSFKPGTTWFEVVGVNSTVQQTDQGWRFLHKMP